MTDRERYVPESRHELYKEFWEDLADEALELKETYDLSLLPWMILGLLGQIAVQTAPRADE